MKLKLNLNSGKGTGHRLGLVMVVKKCKLACRIILIVGEFFLHWLFITICVLLIILIKIS